MPSTTSFSQGDVVLVPFPFTDLSAVKERQTWQNLYNSSGLDSEKTWLDAGFNLGKHFGKARAIDAMKGKAGQLNSDREELLVTDH